MTEARLSRAGAVTTTAYLSSSPQHTRNPPHSHHTIAHTNTCHVPVRTRTPRTRRVCASRESVRERPGGERGWLRRRVPRGAGPSGRPCMRGCRTPRGPSPGPGWVPSASRGAVRTAPPAPAPSSRRHLSGLPSSCGYGAASPHAGTATSEVEVLGRKQANNSFCSVRREDVSSSRRLCSGPGPSPRCFQKLCRSEPRVALLSPAPGDAPGRLALSLTSAPTLLTCSGEFWGAGVGPPSQEHRAPGEMQVPGRGGEQGDPTGAGLGAGPWAGARKGGETASCSPLSPACFSVSSSPSSSSSLPPSPAPPCQSNTACQVLFGPQPWRHICCQKGDGAGR